MVVIAPLMSRNTPKAIRGTQDILGPQAEAFAFVVETFERVRRLYRFRRLEMPVFERTEVFSRAIGETTDVVSKEMGSVAKIVKLEHAWRRLDGRNDDGFQVAPFPG